MRKPNNKQQYEPPELEVYYYVVERGFAQTPVLSTAKSDTYSENTETVNGKTIGGENYTGSWDDDVLW
jgi:hypothetical protein